MPPKDHGYPELRDAIRELCSHYPDEYFRAIDAQRGYPEAFVDALTKAGWLAAMIPQDYGGSGLGLAEASVIMEQINRCGGNAGACHGQMYNMGTLLRHGSAAQKRAVLPKIAAGELRLQSMGVTEPTTGSDTTRIKTAAVKKGDRYVVNGQKVWISRVQHSDLMILLARTTPLADVKIDQHDPVLRGRARARPAAFVLMRALDFGRSGARASAGAPSDVLQPRMDEARAFGQHPASGLRIHRVNARSKATTETT